VIDRIWNWATDNEVAWLAYLCYEAQWLKDKVTGVL
jgi:hypothetical protein